MKRYYELSTEELFALTGDEITVLVELELAHTGVLPAFQPVMGTLPTIDINPTEVAYECDGVLFRCMADAEAFAGMQRCTESYDYNLTGPEYKYLTPSSNYYGIKPRKFYVESQLENVQSQLQDVKRVKATYASEQKEYEKFLKETAAVREAVYSAYSEACNVIRCREKATSMWLKYLTLSDGNVEVAKKFFTDAYKDSPNLVEFILKGVNDENR